MVKDIKKSINSKYYEQINLNKNDTVEDFKKVGRAFKKAGRTISRGTRSIGRSISRGT